MMGKGRRLRRTERERASKAGNLGRALGRLEIQDVQSASLSSMMFLDLV
jgi:hypothetical protein